MNRLGNLLALSLVAGIATGESGYDAIESGRKSRGSRRCPKCNSKAIWHETTAYCTKLRCGWFEVVRQKPVRIWHLLERGPAHNCHECGRIIIPDEARYFDEVSGHIARHVECHEKAGAQ